jgi:hypothetical protein
LALPGLTLRQAGYFDRRLRHEDNVIDLAAYILANPCELV